MDKATGQQKEFVEITDAFPRRSCGHRRISVKSIIPFVCGAVIHLRDPRGSSVTQIVNYLRSEKIVEESHAPLIEVALKKAVKCEVLKELKDGKFKLAEGDCQTIDRLLKEHCNNWACGRKRRRCSRKRKPSCKKPKKRSCPKKPKRCKRKPKPKCRRKCPKVWVPKKCRRKKKCRSNGENKSDPPSPNEDHNTSTGCDSSHWNQDVSQCSSRRCDKFHNPFNFSNFTKTMSDRESDRNY